MTLLLVAAGAAVGAPLRFLTDRALARLSEGRLPWGTLAVNVSGSCLAVLLAAAVTDPNWTALLAVGFCGALTTFSTFSYETLMLIEEGRGPHALANVAANLFGGLAAGLAGFGAAHLLFF